MSVCLSDQSTGRSSDVRRSDEFNGYRILKLQMSDSLSQWERRFVDSKARQKKLSPKQAEVLTALVAKYLRGR